jgi:DNA polymerase-3 subunit gamma/tau
MSYVVLARKWRPQGFPDLIGQEPISRILGNALSQGKIAHAYLFSGPRGVGKTSAARILAKALNCEKGPTPSPCGTCASCTAVVDGSSIDVMEIDGASNNSVNDIRDLRERVKYAPAGGRYKVYIIDEAHMLSDSAFNALLKTLEEPPPHVVFVLATTAARKVPATVLSRCQHLPFRRVPVQKIKGRLRDISEAEGIKISEGAIDLVARAAEGSMRDSLTILDQVSAFAADIKDAEVKDLLGIADFGALSGLSEAVISGNRGRILGIVSELADAGADFKAFAKDLMNFFRDLLVAGVVEKPEEVLDFADGEMAVVKQILKGASTDYLTLLLGEMIRGEAEVRFAFSPRVALEMALLRSSFLSTLRPVREAIENIESFAESGECPPPEKKNVVPRDKDRKKEEVPPAEAEEGSRQEKPGRREETPESPFAGGPPEEVSTVAEKAPDECALVAGDARGVLAEEASTSAVGQADSGGDFWSAILRKVEESNPPLASKLGEAEGVVQGETLTLTFTGGTAIHEDSVRKNQKLIEEIASAVVQRKLSLRIETVKKKVARKKEIREKILSEPLVKEAIELFDGRIVTIKTKENSENGGRDV